LLPCHCRKTRFYPRALIFRLPRHARLPLLNPLSPALVFPGAIRN
jgi:hypothetical protein